MWDPRLSKKRVGRLFGRAQRWQSDFVRLIAASNRLGLGSRVVPCVRFWRISKPNRLLLRANLRHPVHLHRRARDRSEKRGPQSPDASEKLAPVLVSSSEQ